MQHQKINILDPHEAIKIAAGEVIERPANIIKELIENSIDAGATTISIHLNAAGKDLIKITDNGCGMSEIDAKLCFAHHATSKIKSVNDLNSITTYGFRGEALSSVAAVSSVELMTKTDDQKIGTHIKIQHSKFIDQAQIAHQTGTTFIITDLFANIPARKKFLKSDDTEWNQIVTIFQAFCLRYLHINFKLFHNENLSYHCPATESIKVRCAQLWSGNLHDQLIEIPLTSEKNVTLKGAISTPHYYRFNRGQIFTFVNNRWVKNQELVKGILQGYDGVLPHQKYPATFLFVDIDPEIIDVNIHPKKEEVKFLNPGIVQKMTATAIRQALSNFINQKIQATQQPGTTVHKSLTVETKIPDPQIYSQNLPEAQTPTFSYVDQDPFAPETNAHFSKAQTSALPEPWLSSTSDVYGSIQNRVNKNEPTSLGANTQHTILPHHQSSQPHADATLSNSSSLQNSKASHEINAPIFTQAQYSIVGQFKKTYIIIEQENELIMVDQHAAHERIIYERLLLQPESPSVQLMFPHIVKLTSSIVTQLEQYQYLLQQHGIVTESFSQQELIITATPVGMQAAAAEEIVRMLGDLCQQQITISSNILTEKIMSSKACKTACKAGDTLDMQQMQTLLKELMITNNRFSCPHGRPTMWNMSLKEIEKHFKRDYVGSKNSTFNY